MKKRTTQKKVSKKKAKLARSRNAGGPARVAKKQPKKPVKMVKKGITPLFDRVLVKPFSPEEMGTPLPSGIILPETVDKEQPAQGKVIAVGAGRFENGVKIPITVNVGDTVVFSKYSYDEVKWKGEEYFVIKEENILAIIN